jgi:hypothetical protein
MGRCDLITAFTDDLAVLRYNASKGSALVVVHAILRKLDGSSHHGNILFVH